MLLRTIIAEDDDFFRNKLVAKISSIEDIEIAYSTDNGMDLFHAAKKIKPEIIITDIDMPLMNGIEAINAIREELPYTEVIFITSYEKYVKDAIQLYAFDFIEKSFDNHRILDTIEKIKNRFTSIDKAICFKIEDSIAFVRANDLYFVEAMKKKTKIYTSNGVLITNHSMKEVCDMLDEKIFYKSSRSHIINLNKVQKIKPCSRRSYEVTFTKTQSVAYLSRVNYDEFRERIQIVPK